MHRANKKNVLWRLESVEIDGEVTRDPNVWANYSAMEYKSRWTQIRETVGDLLYWEHQKVRENTFTFRTL